MTSCFANPKHKRTRLRTAVSPCASCPCGSGPVDLAGRSCGRHQRSGRRLGRFHRIAWRRRPDHGDRFAAQPANHRLRRQWRNPAGAGVERPKGTRDARRRLQRPPEECGPLLEPLRQCLDAPHAAAHVVGHRAAWRAAARICGLAWLRPPALCVRPKSVRRDPARHAGDRRARRCGARRDRPPGSVPREVGSKRLGRRPRRRGRRGGQEGGSGEARRRDGLAGGRRRRRWPCAWRKI